MSFKISPSIDESELTEWLKKARQKYGLYENRGVDFTNANVAPIVMCTIICKDELLLVKRGYGLADAEGYWSTVNGFIDEIKSVKEIAQQEVKEELGLNVSLGNIQTAKSYELENPKEKRKYIVFACLITLKSKPKIILDREHTDYVWTTRGQVESYEILDDLSYAIDIALRLRTL